MVPSWSLLVVWCIGIAFGYWLAWKRFSKAYVLVDKEKLKHNQAQLATQSPKQNTRCACCKTTARNEADTSFACDCAWSAYDLLSSGSDLTCTLHRTEK